MKKTTFTLIFLLCSPWAVADMKKTMPQPVNSEDDNVINNTIQVNTRPEIAGLWGMEIPNNKKCIEYYNFKNDNNVVIKSGNEWTTGLYEYQYSAEERNLAPTLVLQVKYDNDEKDCSGNTEDQSGEISQYFVKWKTPNIIDFCTNAQANECFATLRRVLP